MIARAWKWLMDGPFADDRQRLVRVHQFVLGRLPENPARSFLLNVTSGDVEYDIDGARINATMLLGLSRTALIGPIVALIAVFGFEIGRWWYPPIYFGFTVAAIAVGGLLCTRLMNDLIVRLRWRDWGDLEQGVQADEIRKLHELREEGIISTEEFEARRAQLLPPPAPEG